MPYKENHQFLKKDREQYGVNKYELTKGIQAKLLQYVLANTPANDPLAIINGINSFCRSNWMMNLGDEKGEILKIFLKKYDPATILEIGGYCGFSSLLFAYYSNSTIHSIEPNEEFASVARRIHEHAGMAKRIVIHVGTVQTEGHFIKEHGKFDMIFIDHWKELYLQDFLELEKLQVIKKGTVVVGDNIIEPGAPDYLKHFQTSELYDSELYHSYLEYNDLPDAVLASLRGSQND